MQKHVPWAKETNTVPLYTSQVKMVSDVANWCLSHPLVLRKWSACFPALHEMPENNLPEKTTALSGKPI